MIEKSSIEELKQRVDIVDIISHYVELKKSGSNYVCVCPFHDDKNPSMSVNSIKGFYHCFACQSGGDVFKFVQDYERLDFSAAVEKVAQLSNFSLRYSDKKDSFKASREILPLLNSFYKSSLAKHKEAISYLYERGLNDEDIRKFELGYAPSSEQSLEVLKKAGVNSKDAFLVGALKLRDDNKSYYAAFSKRITFPIYDMKGLLVGFGGRIIDDSNRAKYLNSSQNSLFDKARIFYALNLAKDEIIKKKEIIICEGYIDVIALHKAGFKNAVAILGTALTTEHIKLIKKLEAKVILCLDSDKAGINAAFKSSYLLSLHKIEGKACMLKGGKDVAELVFNNQMQELYAALDGGLDFVEFYIRILLAKFDLNNILQKQKALEEVKKFTFELEPMIARHYEPLLAKLLNEPLELIKLSKMSKKQSNSQPTKQAFEKKFDLAEAEICQFLYNNEHYKSIFKEVSNENFFIMKDTIKELLSGSGYENSAIREVQMRNLDGLKDGSEFLQALCNLNCAFLNRQKQSTVKDFQKKQAINMLNQRLSKIKKSLKTQKAFFSFLHKALKFMNDENLDEDSFCKTLEYFMKELKQENYDEKIFLKDEDESISTF